MREIVIKIDEGMYEDMLSDFDLARQIVRGFQATIADAIQKGVPLPEGHGRLIDADKLLDANIDTFSQQTELKIKSAPTILEADKESI